MLCRTHLAFGLLVGLVALNYINLTYVDKFIFVSLVIFASMLPDLDHPDSKLSNKIPVIPKIISMVSKHRGIFHSIFFALLLSGAVYYFFGFSYGIALFIGYMSHLIIDGLTKQGINFLHPIGRLHMAGFVETGTIGEMIVLAVLIALIGVFLI